MILMNVYIENYLCVLQLFICLQQQWLKITSALTLSRVYESVTNNKGFGLDDWIY
jgi:hypothetical protein